MRKTKNSGLQADVSELRPTLPVTVISTVHYVTKPNPSPYQSAHCKKSLAMARWVRLGGLRPASLLRALRMLSSASPLMSIFMTSTRPCIAQQWMGSRICKQGRKEMFYLTTHSTHFIYGYMASDIWLRTILIVRKETRCRHIGYSFRLTARVLLYAPSHRQDSTYHGLCYTSRGALAGTRNSSMGSPHEGSIRRPIAP